MLLYLQALFFCIPSISYLTLPLKAGDKKFGSSFCVRELGFAAHLPVC